MSDVPVVDSHVHFWDPGELAYPWLGEVPPLRRPYLPRDYAEAAGPPGVERIVFVEANPRPDQGVREVEFAGRLAAAEPRIGAIVAFVDLTDPARDAVLDELAGHPLVRGVRHNIQGNPPGFCLQPAYVAGVREVGRRGLAFDLCATHDQLPEVVELARACPDTRLVLDHCGKPGIRAGRREPWAADLSRLSALDHVWCKLSGLLTEADPRRRREEDLLPYAEHVVESFGPGRLMYGSDWPVLTLAGGHAEWYQFTRRLTRAWSPDETRRFYRDNAVRFYDL